MFAGVADRAGVVKVRADASQPSAARMGRTRKMQPGEPESSADRRGSPPNRSSILPDPQYGCQPSTTWPADGLGRCGCRRPGGTRLSLRGFVFRVDRRVAASPTGAAVGKRRRDAPDLQPDTTLC